MSEILRRVGYALGLVTILCCINVGTVAAGNALCSPQAPPEVLASEVCQTSGDPIAGPGGLINDITQLVSVVAGIAAVIMIMVGGFMYITSGGDSGKIQEAKKTLTWSFIGLVVIVLARTIILFVVNRL
jgi:hypothetical protein